METLRRFGMTELRPGQFVLVRFGPGSKGMMAAEIQPKPARPAFRRTDRRSQSLVPTGGRHPDA